jgi:hypothetical protein
MNDLQKGVKEMSIKLTKFTKREAKETRIAAKILGKVISNNFKLTNKSVTPEEINFLKEHSLDLMKIIPMIVMFPTPIPYIEILLVLKGLGIDILLPKEEDLKIPDGSE